jgi:glycosyltransferase involved in cell wall biosynthesis
MRALYLTSNPNLGSTTRTLQAWLLAEPHHGVQPFVCVQKPGAFASWLASHRIPHQINPMPWFDKRNPFKSLWHAGKLAAWARRAGVDLVHCNEHDVYPFGVIVARLLRQPIVCHIRFQVAEPFCSWAFKEGRKPDAILWTSQQQKSDCASAIQGFVSESRQHVIHLGLDLTNFGASGATRTATRQQWGVEPDVIVLGSATALRPRKRIEDFVELVQRATAHSPRVVGVLAGDVMPGDEAYRDAINDQITRSRLGPRFKQLGNIDDVEPFYHAIDIFISTSSYETFGMSVLEAMACRRPVVAYHGGSVHEVVGDSGFIVENGDVDALTAATALLIDDPVRRGAAGAMGYQRAEDHFNTAKSIRRLVQLYESIVSARRHGAQAGA